MRIYPRPNKMQYGPVPAYTPQPPFKKLASVALLGLISTGFFAGHTIWIGKPAAPAANTAPAAAAALPHPELPLPSPPAAEATTPAAQTETLAFVKEPTPYSFKGAAGVEMDFAPRADSERLTQRLLSTAQSNIRIQAFHLQSAQLQSLLLAALQRNVRVEIMVDDAIGRDSKTILGSLKKAGAVIYLNARSGTHHDKTIIVDDRNVLVGSLNFTRDAKDLDFTNVMVISNPEVAKLYLEHWNSHLVTSSTR